MDISPTWLTVLNWVFTATALSLSVGRYVIRYRDRRRLFWDDLLHFLGLLCGIGSVVGLQFTLSMAIQVRDSAMAGEQAPLSFLDKFFVVTTVQSVAFLLCIYFIKMAFLAFYRMLFAVNATFVCWWWIVTFLVVASFITSIAGALTLCGSASKIGNVAACSTPQANTNTSNLLYYSTALNVFTDIAIMILPIYVLRGIQISRQQKIGLGALFSLGVVIIVFEILRFVEFLPSVGENGSITMPLLWSALETNIAIVVSCLPTYRSLLSNEKRRRAQRLRDERYDQTSWNLTAVTKGITKDSQTTVHSSHSPEGPEKVLLPTVLRGPGNESR